MPCDPDPPGPWCSAGSSLISTLSAEEMDGVSSMYRPLRASSEDGSITGISAGSDCSTTSAAAEASEKVAPPRIRVGLKVSNSIKLQIQGYKI